MGGKWIHFEVLNIPWSVELLDLTSQMFLDAKYIVEKAVGTKRSTMLSISKQNKKKSSEEKAKLTSIYPLFQFDMAYIENDKTFRIQEAGFVRSVAMRFQEGFIPLNMPGA